MDPLLTCSIQFISLKLFSIKYIYQCHPHICKQNFGYVSFCKVPELKLCICFFLDCCTWTLHFIRLDLFIVTQINSTNFVASHYILFSTFQLFLSKTLLREVSSNVLNLCYFPHGERPKSHAHTKQHSGSFKIKLDIPNNTTVQRER